MCLVHRCIIRRYSLHVSPNQLCCYHVVIMLLLCCYIMLLLCCYYVAICCYYVVIMLLLCCYYVAIMLQLFCYYVVIMLLLCCYYVVIMLLLCCLSRHSRFNLSLITISILMKANVTGKRINTVHTHSIYLDSTARFICYITRCFTNNLGFLGLDYSFRLNNSISFRL